jgi:hypothetical protein
LLLSHDEQRQRRCWTELLQKYSALQQTPIKAVEPVRGSDAYSELFNPNAGSNQHTGGLRHILSLWHYGRRAYGLQETRPHGVQIEAAQRWVPEGMPRTLLEPPGQVSNPNVADAVYTEQSQVEPISAGGCGVQRISRSIRRGSSRATLQRERVPWEFQPLFPIPTDGNESGFGKNLARYRAEEGVLEDDEVRSRSIAQQHTFKANDDLSAQSQRANLLW